MVGRTRPVPFYAMWIAVAAVAIGAAVGVRSQRRPAGEMEALVTASEPAMHRLIEPRLSGGFPHKPLHRVPRTAMPIAIPSGIESSHAVGLAYLINGDPRRAIPCLERAAAHAPGAAHILNDLATARYEQALQSRRPSELVSAFTTFTRALELEPRNPEALFGRALVLQRLHLHDDAVVAWRAYLEVDAVSAWAIEARAHVDLLERRHPGSSVEERRTQIEETMFGDWAAAVLAKDSAAAEAALAKAEKASGDMAMDGTARAALEQIRGAANPHSLAIAHRDYAEARRLYLRARDETACAAMKAAAAALEQQRAPLAARAWVYAATVSHYLGRSDAALRMLDRVEALQRGFERERPLATGQAEWVRGLIFQARGEPEAALRAYLAARPHLQAAHEATSLAGISSVLSETYRYLGDKENAWTENLRALEWLLEPSVTYARRQGVQNDTALLAIDQGHPGLAGLVAERVAKRARDANDPLFETLALLTRARALMAGSRHAEARRDLDAASGRAAPLPRNGSTARLFADILLARAEALTESEPAAAVQYVRAAATELQDLRHRSRLPRLYLLGGRAWRRLGDESAAERSWRAGLAEFETQRSGLTDHRDRSTFSDAGRALFDEVVALLVARGADAEALAIVRQARMAGVTLPIPSAPAAPSAATGRQRGAVVEYYLLPQELLIWATSEGTTRFHRIPADAGELARGVERFAAHVRDCETTAECERESGKWFDLLLRPADVRAGELWIAPDAVLHRVPFAALFDRRRRRFVAEDHSVTILLGPATAPPQSALRSALVTVAPGAADDQPSLQSAEREGAIAARAFPVVTVLRGADATPARFLDEIGGHDAVHFAGHVLVDEWLPGRSALRLANGSLYAGQLSGRVFPRTRLVVLAGCETARGTATTAGPLSYARAFAATGVPQVIGSLWPVDDTASAAFFRDFYAALKSGESPAMAIATAQRHALTSGSAPHAWANYQLYAGAGRTAEKGHS